MLVFEVQENSDTTFRLFDWDHVDAKTGKPRELQVDKALAAIDYKQGLIQPLADSGAGSAGKTLLSDPHFHLKRWQRSTDFMVGKPGEARVLVCAEGKGSVTVGEHETAMKRGEVVLLPAVVGAGRFRPDTPVTLFEVAIPE